MAGKDYDDEKVTKGLTERERETLPNWAQERMSNLRQEAESAAKKYDQLFDSQEPSTIAYGDIYLNPKFLPDGPYDRISISLDGSIEPQDHLWMTVARKTDPVSKENYVEVSSSDGIASVPQALNVIRLYPFCDGEILSPRETSGSDS